MCCLLTGPWRIVEGTAQNGRIDGHRPTQQKVVSGLWSLVSSSYEESVKLFQVSVCPYVRVAGLT